MKNLIKHTISNKAHWIINKSIAKEIGLDATLILQHFIDIQNNLFGGKEFYQQMNRLEEALPLTEYAIRGAVKLLKERDIVSVVKKGIPAKNYYKVNEEAVIELLNTIDDKTTDDGMEEQVLSNETTCANETTSDDDMEPPVLSNQTTGGSEMKQQVTDNCALQRKETNKKELREKNKSKKVTNNNSEPITTKNKDNNEDLDSLFGNESEWNTKVSESKALENEHNQDFELFQFLVEHSNHHKIKQLISSEVYRNTLPHSYERLDLISNWVNNNTELIKSELDNISVVE